MNLNDKRKDYAQSPQIFFSLSTNKRNRCTYSFQSTYSTAQGRSAVTAVCATCACPCYCSCHVSDQFTQTRPPTQDSTLHTSGSNQCSLDSRLSLLNNQHTLLIWELSQTHHIVVVPPRESSSRVISEKSHTRARSMFIVTCSETT